MNDSPVYILTLRPLPDAADPGGIRRLRALVKAALRSYRLRCVGIRPAVGQQAGADIESGAPGRGPQGMSDMVGVPVAEIVAGWAP